MAARLEHRVLSGGAANLASIVAIFVQNVALVPILLHKWSPKTYGIWVTVIAAQSLLAAISSGNDNYLGNEASRLLHEDRQKLGPLLGTGVFLSNGLGLLQLAIVLAIGRLGSSATFGLPAVIDGVNYLYLILLVVGSWIGFGSTANLMVRVAYALGYYAPFTWMNVIYRAILSVVLVIGAVHGFGILGASLCYAVVTAVCQCVILVLALGTMRRHNVSLGRPQFRMGLRLFRQSSFLSTTTLLESLSNSGLITIISRALSSSAVSLFSSTRTIANTALQGVGMILFPLNPDIIRFHAKKEFRKLDQVFQACWMAAGSPVNLGLCMLPIFLEPLYRTWTRGKLHLDFPLFATLGAAVAFRTFSAPWMGYLGAVNAVSMQTMIAVLRGVTVVGLSIVLLKVWGLFGVGVALAVADFLGPVVVAGYCVSRLLNSARGQPSEQSIAVPAASVAVVILTYVGVASLPRFTLVFCLLGTSLVAWLTLVQWKRLGGDTKHRLTSVVMGLVSRLRRGRPKPALEGV